VTPLPEAERASAAVPWPDDVDDVLGGDVTAALAYVTPAGGAVVTAVATCGARDRERGTVSFTTLLGFPRKLQRILRDPRVALAWHAREHGLSTSRQFVLAQGLAGVDLTPSRERLEAFVPSAERFMGPVKRGVVWDRLLHEYYLERVFVDVAVTRVRLRSVGRLGGAERPRRTGSAPAGVPGPCARRHRPAGRRPQARTAGGPPAPPRRGPRRGGRLPGRHPGARRGHGAEGLRLTAAPGLLPLGGRRAGCSRTPTVPSSWA
jgi:hypothetical protein